MGKVRASTAWGMMQQHRQSHRNRTLLGGRIVFNSGRSAIDCTVRNLSRDGACIEVANVAGIPREFHLRMSGETELQPCRLEWADRNRLGISFGHDQIGGSEPAAEMKALRAALDEIEVGIVLLDPELRARLINRAFRRIWRLPDEMANANPPFVALMYHSRDIGAYVIGSEDIDAYVARRIGLVKSADTDPIDVRLTGGAVVRFQCSPLPDGGRMLTYTVVSDIVSHADELEVLKTAIEHVNEGIILLDSDLGVQYMNAALRNIWKISDAHAASRPNFRELVSDNRISGALDLPPQELDAFIAQRIARVQAGDPAPQDIKLKGGRHVRSRCSILPSGGRMLTFSDITDLVRNSDELRRLAITDGLSGLYNRRHFLTLAQSEWERFQRHHRPLSMLMVDIDHFKSVNDQFGHAAGDEVLAAVAHACAEDRRASDIVGRIGGEEFALLLPETTADQAESVAQRICQRMMRRRFLAAEGHLRMTVSIGVAEASPAMSSATTLLAAADQGLYLAKSGGRNRVGKYRPPDSGCTQAAE